jgi:hypothetical protein
MAFPRQLLATNRNGFGLIAPFPVLSHLSSVATGRDRSAR